jgi:hypothetical protein
MTIQECILSIEQTTRRLQERRLRSMIAVEWVILPAWRPKPRLPKKTQTMRANFKATDVSLLQHILETPGLIIALTIYRTCHQRVIQPKRITADPDVPCPDWRSRPERHLTARQLIEQQLSGKAMMKELKRLR